MDEVRWLDEREERAWRALQFMQMRLTSRLARDLGTYSELSYPDYLVLVALSDEAQGRQRPFELAATLGWEKSRLSHQLARMSARGLVAKEKCGDDRRGSYVVATDRGRRAIEAAAPHHVETVRRLVVDRLTSEQLDALGDAAARILEVLAAEDDAER